MKAYTHAEWLEAFEAHGGIDAAFVCPSCGATWTPREAQAAGHEPEWAATRCRHRVLDGGKPCDWCAFGLFRGPVIITCDDGSELAAFDFAEASGT